MTSFVKHNKGLSVFVTGSNSKCLSDDIRKAFKEMAVIIKLRPLSFSQVRKTMPEYEIDDYLTYGSLPVVLKEKPENRFPLLKASTGTFVLPTFKNGPMETIYPR